MHQQAGAAAGTGAGCLQKQAMDHTMTDYGSSVPVLRQSDRGIVTLPFRHGLSTCTRQSGRLTKRVSADSTDTAKKRLADQDGSSRTPGILFPTGREPCSRLPGDVLCPPVRFFPAVPLPPEKWPPSLKGRAVLCLLSEFYCNFARTTHLR